MTIRINASKTLCVQILTVLIILRLKNAIECPNATSAIGGVMYGHGRANGTRLAGNLKIQPTRSIGVSEWEFESQFMKGYS
ncbi:MAG: hypothetical protein QNI88_13165, partial [Desulfobacterales bacterium]|nr:hypothetical protein [Desulfobacterales bacterium]